MRNVVSANPFRCRMWALHDRIDSYITEESCREEISSFLQRGQMICALGRPLKGDPDFDIELIYGSRRLFVARHLNVPLLVELRELSDQEATAVMDIENRHRQDVSPYERGRSYARWLQSGCFKSQDELARALKISAAQVSRLLRLSQLPAVVVGAFPSATQICEGWGLRLMQALAEPAQRKRTLDRARVIAARDAKQPAEDVFRELIAASAPGRKPPKRVRDEVVKDGSGGAPLFRIRQLRGSIAIVLSLKDISAESLANIRDSITDILTSPKEVDTQPSCSPVARKRKFATPGRHPASPGSDQLETPPPLI